MNLLIAVFLVGICVGWWLHVRYSTPDEFGAVAERDRIRRTLNNRKAVR